MNCKLFEACRLTEKVVVIVLTTIIAVLFFVNYQTGAENDGLRQQITELRTQVSGLQTATTLAEQAYNKTYNELESLKNASPDTAEQGFYEGVYTVCRFIGGSPAKNCNDMIKEMIAMQIYQRSNQHLDAPGEFNWGLLNGEQIQ